MNARLLFLTLSELPPSLAEGSYVTSYRTISADSHPVGGSIVFSVGAVSESMRAPMAAAGDSGWTAAMVIVRAILYAGILGGAGGVLFLLLVRPTDLASGATSRIAAISPGRGAWPRSLPSASRVTCSSGGLPLTW
jgi:copper transport protein